MVYQDGRAQLDVSSREAALSILKTCKRLEVQSENALKNSNFLTRLFVFLSDFFHGKINIQVNSLNPFNEGKTILEKIRSSLDLSEDFYSTSSAIQDLSHFRGIIEHAIWEANGSIDFGYDYDFGGNTLRSNPKGSEVKNAIDLILSFPSVNSYVQDRNLQVQVGDWLR